MLSTAAIRTLEAIVAQDGIWEHDTHMGSIARHGGARKTDVARLIHAGLAEWRKVEDPTRQEYSVTTSLRVFATANGLKELRNCHLDRAFAALRAERIIE